MQTQDQLVLNRIEYEDRCHRSGYRAYERGSKLAQCPLAKGSGAREAWEGGWEQARHEHEDSPPND